MGFITWALFWPDSSNKSIFFHIFRQFTLICLIILATTIHPSIFTMYLLLLSLIEYSRRISTQNLIFLYFTFNFGCWLAGFINMPENINHNEPKTIIFDFLRGIFLFLALIIDRLTSKRFSLTSHVTAFSFPIILSSCTEILSVIDHLGVSTHLSAFCNDYPDFTFLPFLLFGPIGVIFFIGFFASYTSRWRVNKGNPKLIRLILFQIIPTLLIIVFCYRYFYKKNYNNLKIIIINNENLLNLNYFFYNNLGDLLIFTNPIFLNNSLNLKNNINYF